MTPKKTTGAAPRATRVAKRPAAAGGDRELNRESGFPQLANYLQKEYPQTVAVVLSKITPEHSARVLALLPEGFAMEVVMRMLRREAVQKDVLDDVERTLRTEFMTNLARTRFPPWGVQGGRPGQPGRSGSCPGPGRCRRFAAAGPCRHR